MQAAMAWFDRQEAIVCRLFREDRTADAVQEAIQTCRHLGPEPEPPALRDARADLLLRTIMAQISDGHPCVTATNEETALLERRIFNWMHDGKDEEAERFPTYTPFDEGMDREPPQAFLQYFNKQIQNGVPSDYIRWLQAVDKSMEAEIWDRCMRLKPGTLRIGCRVLAAGLIKAPHLNGQPGTITCTQGQRWGVIFDSGISKAVLPANLRCKPAASSDTNLQIEVAQAMNSLRLATDWVEAQPDMQTRREIAHRMKLARRVLSGECPPMKCAEPHELPEEEAADEYERSLMKLKSMVRCHGNGSVNFLAMVQTSQERNGEAMKEWLVSGLCAECQKKTFIV